MKEASGFSPRGSHVGVIRFMDPNLLSEVETCSDAWSVVLKYAEPRQVARMLGGRKGIIKCDLGRSSMSLKGLKELIQLIGPNVVVTGANIRLKNRDIGIDFDFERMVTLRLQFERDYYYYNIIFKKINNIKHLVLSSIYVGAVDMLNVLEMCKNMEIWKYVN